LTFGIFLKTLFSTGLRGTLGTTRGGIPRIPSLKQRPEEAVKELLKYQQSLRTFP
jgi:hypothetical protein